MPSVLTTQRCNRDPRMLYAARRLRALGVAVGPARDIDEWVGLVDDLDRFSALGFGSATQRRFLHAPHPDLGNCSPITLLSRNDGPRRVRRALQHTLDNAFAAAS